MRIVSAANEIFLNYVRLLATLMIPINNYPSIFEYSLSDPSGYFVLTLLKVMSVIRKEDKRKLEIF